MKYLMALLLIPSLVAGQWDQYPKSVRKLLEKLWEGPARLTLRDGTKSEGQLLRVTTEYIAFAGTLRSGSPAPCEHIALSRIATVSRPPGYSGSDFGDEIMFGLIFGPVMLPFLIKDAIYPNPLEGNWELAGAADGRVGVLTFSGDWLTVEETMVSEGRYRLDGNALYFNAQPVEVTLQCGHGTDELVTTEMLLMHSPREADYRQARRPIAGNWANRLTSWDLGDDGTFHNQTTLARRAVKFRRSHNRITLDSGEEWTFRRARGHLFITAAGVTTGYHPRAYR
jgi:hypothetical protein